MERSSGHGVRRVGSRMCRQWSRRRRTIPKLQIPFSSCISRPVSLSPPKFIIATAKCVFSIVNTPDLPVSQVKARYVDVLGSRLSSLPKKFLVSDPLVA